MLAKPTSGRYDQLHMASACHQCGDAVDPLRSKARVFDGKVVAICQSCIGEPGERSQVSGAPAPANDRLRLSTCSECGKTVSAHQAKATIVGASIRVRCDDCVAGRATAEPEQEIPAPAATQPRRLRRWGYAATAIVVAGVVPVVLIPYSQSTAPASPPTTLATNARPPNTEQIIRAQSVAVVLPPSDMKGDEEEINEHPPETEILPEEELAEDLQVADANERKYRFTPGKLDPKLEIDGVWTHPLPGTIRLMPTKSTRRFGAVRPGRRPRECRGGHCGIDLGAPRGTPVVAVAEGVILKAVRSTHDRGGRYVKIEHQSGMISYYMHLDRVLAGLRAGDTVQAGQMLGTLGRTGIHTSAPHLHFMVKVPTNRGMLFVDPEPMFADALVIDLLDMTVGPDDTVRASVSEFEDQRAGESAAETALHKSALGFVPGM